MNLGGYLDRNVRFWVDADKLKSKGMTVTDVIAALQREHVELPAGRLETEGREISVRVMGEALDLATLRKISLRDLNGAPVYLDDVALVEDGFEDERRIARVNGAPAQGLGIRKQRGSNAVAVAQGVKAAMAEILVELASDPALRARLLSRLGDLAALQGQLDQARQRYDQAAALPLDEAMAHAALSLVGRAPTVEIAVKFLKPVMTGEALSIRAEVRAQRRRGPIDAAGPAQDGAARARAHECDVVAAEDTRLTGQLLKHFATSKPLLSYFQFNEAKRSEEIIERLRRGEKVALVTDAGKPGIRDPGERVVRAAIEAGGCVASCLL